MTDPRLPIVLFLLGMSLWDAWTCGADEGLDPAGANQNSVPIVRTMAPPHIDGRLSEAVWEEAAVISDFTQAEPDEGSRPSEKTRVYLLYDSDALYIGIRAYDTEPDRIVAKERQRDISLDGDDTIAIVLDPFRDRRHGYYFQVNPLGTRRDGLIAQGRDSGSLSQIYKAEWDGIWEAAARSDAEGWTAEIAIPTKTLSFDPANEAWGFNIERKIARRNELVRWRGARRGLPVFALGEAGAISGIKGMNQGVGLDLVPYVKGRGARDDVGGHDEVDLKPGLDLFFKPTPSVTFALTINTDFAETEVDDRQVNLTRFPLFFPEKRAFFLQDANFFEFGGIAQSPLPFFSRRIGLSGTGEPIDLLGGVKATGRMGRLSFGILDVQVDGSRNLDSKNLAVGRAAWDIGEESTVGVIFTRGNPLTDDQNLLGGSDLNYKTSDLLGTGQVLEAHAYLMRSDTAGRSDSAFGGRILYPNFTWRAGLLFDQIGREFNPPLGFISQAGTREESGWIGHAWRPKPLDTLYLEIYGRMKSDLDNRLIEGELWLPYIEVTTHSRDEFSFVPIYWVEQFFEPFEVVPGVLVREGQYHSLRYEARFQTAVTRPFGASSSVNWGGYADGTRTDWNTKMTWRAVSWFNLSATYQQNLFALPTGDFTVHLAQLNLNFAFTPDLFWNVVGQYDNVTEEAGFSSRIRWTVKPGSDLFLVLNRLFDSSQGGLRPLSGDLSAKVLWTLRF